MAEIIIITRTGDENENTFTIMARANRKHVLHGMGGDDVLVLTGQSNTFSELWGDGGDDYLQAADSQGRYGYNYLEGGRGTDTMVGGACDDIFFVNRLSDVVMDASLDDNDGVVTSTGSYRLGATLDFLSYRGEGTFSGSGNARDNSIGGGGNDDVLRGLQGNDYLEGGRNGADTLIGGLGADILHARVGGQQTILQYDRLADSGRKFGVDRIWYMGGDDRIDLSGIDANPATPIRNDRFSFIGEAEFSADATGEVRYEWISHSTMEIQVSTDGDAAPEMMIQITIANVMSLTEANFIL